MSFIMVEMALCGCSVYTVFISILNIKIYSRYKDYLTVAGCSYC